MSLDTDLRYQYVNSRAEDILQRDKSELLGEYMWDVFDEAADSIAYESIESAIETGEPVSFERYNSRIGRWLEVRIYPSDDGLTILFTDITDARATMRRLDKLVETAPMGIAILDETGTITRANRRGEELLGLTKSEIEGRHYTNPEWNIWDEDGEPIPAEDHPVTRVLEGEDSVTGFTHGITLPDGSERWLSSNVAPILGENRQLEQIVVVLEDITDSKRLAELIRTFQPVNELLAQANSRAEVEQGVCDLLTDEREYDIAWIGEFTAGTILPEPRVDSGVASDILEETALPLAEGGPPADALAAGEIQVVEDIHTDPRFEPYSEALQARDLQSTAAVPLVYNDHIYGVLVLCTSRFEAFDTREQQLLKVLGNLVGRVIHGLETEQHLHSDTVVELTFRSTDTGSFLVRGSEKFGCRLSVTSMIPTGENGVLSYVSVDNCQVTPLKEFLDQSEGVVETRTLQETDDGSNGAIEIITQDGMLGHALAINGAVIVTDRAVDGSAKIICEIPPSRDISELVANLTASFPATELVAKREYSRSQENAGQSSERALADAFESELTDRQRQVLRAAVHGGYFESPRLSTATELADALSLTQSTVSYHLRKAEETLFTRMLDQR